MKEERLREELEFECQLERDEMLQLHQLVRKLTEEEHKLCWYVLCMRACIVDVRMSFECQLERD